MFSKARIGVVAACAFYIASVYAAYIWKLTGSYAYEGFTYKGTAATIVTACAIAFLPSLVLPAALKRPSQLVYWMLYLLVVVPGALVPAFSGHPRGIQSLAPGLAVTASFVLLGYIYRLPYTRLRPLRLRPAMFGLVLLGCSVLTYGLIVRQFGFAWNMVALADVYSVRTEFKNAMEGGGVLGYLLVWQAYVTNPLLLIHGLVHRRWTLLALGTAGQLFLYSTTGFRTVLFSAVYLVVMYWAVRKSKGFGSRLGWAYTAVVAATTAIFAFAHDIELFSLAVVRMIATPGLLTGYYFEFFSTHPKALLGYSIFRSWVHYPYTMEPPPLIGWTYFHYATWANANVWADAFANFGYVGVVAFTALLAAVLWFYDSITQDVDRRIAALVLAVPSIALANAGLLTCLLSHGILFACALMYVYSPDQREQPARVSLQATARPNTPAVRVPNAYWREVLRRP